MERTFAHLGRYRRLAKDFEHLAACVIAHILTASIHVMAQALGCRLMLISKTGSYIRTHTNRFGRYELDLNRRPPAIDYDLAVFADHDRAPATASTSAAPALTG